MTVMELIEHVGGVAEYCKCVVEWSKVVLKAHEGKHTTAYFNNKYKHISVEYYILRMSKYKTTRPYKRKKQLV